MQHDPLLTGKPIRVKLKDPPIGNKMHLIMHHGIYVLEESPCMVRAVACTHAGSGGVIIYDGVPDEHGYFPADTPMSVLVPENPTEEELAAALELYYNRNGRPVYYANPAVMGMWMFDGGLMHGFTLVSLSDAQTSAPIITITWAGEKKKK